MSLRPRRQRTNIELVVVSAGRAKALQERLGADMLEADKRVGNISVDGMTVPHIC